MTDGGRAMVTAGIALCSLLVGCGQTKDETLTVVASGGTAGTSTSAALGGTDTVAGSSSSGGTNAWGGASAVTDPGRPVSNVNVSGRWALFGFEDPVGVDLRQNEGVLSGIGCGVGTPPASNAAYCSADLAGAVAGSQVKFDFKSTAEILPGRYLTELVAAEDGSRMAGRFGIGTSVSKEVWIAWLPVQGDDFWLQAPQNDAPYHSKGFDIHLVSAEAGDPAFDPQTTYRIYIGPDGLGGELGAFYLSEMRRSADGVVEAGPVSPTVPELPVYVALSGAVGDAFSRVTARLSNGHTFEFTVLPFL